MNSKEHQKFLPNIGRVEQLLQYQRQADNLIMLGKLYLRDYRP